MSQIHVLMFCPYLSSGGAERHMVRVANALDGSQFRVTFVVLRSGGAFAADLHPRIKVHSLNRRMPWSLRSLIGAINRFEPDVVFATTDLANCLAILAGKLAIKRPALVAGVAIAVTVNISHETGWRRLLMKVLIPRIYPLADQIVVPCQGVGQDLLSWLPRLREKICVIYNAGIDDSLEVLRDVPMDIPPQYRSSGATIIAVGRLVPQKGYVHLLEAMSLIRESLPVKLWIVGAGPLEQELKALVHSKGISQDVWFAGFQENPYALMGKADVFVLPSLWEGFGIVVAEAMACGVPVVATDCPYGPGEIISNRSEGILVPPADSASLADALSRVLTDRDCRATMREAGLRRAQTFTASSSAGEHAALFSRLVRASSELSAQSEEGIR